MLLTHASADQFSRVVNESITWYGSLQAMQARPVDRDFQGEYYHEDLFTAANLLNGLTMLYKNIGIWFPSSIKFVTSRKLDHVILDGSCFKNMDKVATIVNAVLSKSDGIDVQWLVPTDHVVALENLLISHGMIVEVVDLSAIEDDSQD